MSTSRYADRRFNPRLYQYVVSLSKTIIIASVDSADKYTRGREHPREGGLFSIMSSSEEIALKNQHY